jgi:Glutaminase
MASCKTCVNENAALASGAGAAGAASGGTATSGAARAHRLPAGVVTQARADALFRELAANKNIPFDYPLDCCFSRAHAMCKIMTDKGVRCDKVWYFAKNWGAPNMTPDLRPVKPDGKPVTFPEDGKERPVEWVYHVAPLIKVQGADGKLSEKVIDPSLATRPLSKAEWEAIMGKPIGAYEETSDGAAYFENDKEHIREEDPTGAKANAMMAEHKLNRDAARATMSKKP